MDAVILKHQASADDALPPSGANKYEVLRELSAARDLFGLSDRDMAVLQALVSFQPGTVLGGNSDDLVVHPSNKSLCERLNGMADSTMRRHLSHLVQAGVVVRRDSPNGKRYARRYGDEKIAYGFDLSPLARRFAEFCEAAEAVRAAQARYKRMREAVSLMRRDLAGLADYGSTARPDLRVWDAFSDLAVLTARDLRRTLSEDELEAIQTRLQGALDHARNVLEPKHTEDMSTNAVINEQHYQNSNTDSYDLEPRKEKAKGDGVAPALRDAEVSGQEEVEVGRPDTEDSLEPLESDHKLPNIPLGLVMASCKEILTYVEGGVRHWHELVVAADRVRPMMGISPSAWEQAKLIMGPEEASVVLAAMLERFGDIQSPGGYLRHLTAKAQDGAFSCGPMIMSLTRRAAA